MQAETIEEVMATVELRDKDGKLVEPTKLSQAELDAWYEKEFGTPKAIVKPEAFSQTRE